jgi:hypothetical protein
MTIGICFSLVILPFVAKPLHKKLLNAGKKADEKTENEEAAPVTEGKKKKRGIAGFIDYVTPALFIGLIGAFVTNSILGKGKDDIPLDGAGTLSVLTLATAIIVSAVLEAIAKKFKLTWLEPFVMPIGMVAAMGVAVLVYNVAPDFALIEWRG